MERHTGFESRIPKGIKSPNLLSSANIIEFKSHTKFMIDSKLKGDIAVTKVISDLTEKNYIVFRPIVAEHIPYDLIVEVEEKFYKLQVKYMCSERPISEKTVSSNSQGYKVKKYKETDFDFYALYYPEHKTILYPAFCFRGKTIRFSMPKNGQGSYFYEDFLGFTTVAQKRFVDLKQELKPKKSKIIEIKNNICKKCETPICNNAEYCIHCWPRKQKIQWPSKEDLKKLVWEIPMSKLSIKLGVSNKSIVKRCLKLEIDTPPQGWFLRKENATLL